MSNTDVLNEVKVFEKLSSDAFLVQIYGHGWLPHSDHYIDMELCSFNLDTWIRNNTARGRTLSAINASIANMPESHGRLRSEGWELLEELLSIIFQIIRGLSIVHDHKLIHRGFEPEKWYVF